MHARINMKVRRIDYDPVAYAFSRPQFGGASLPYFQGGRQYGSGWLRTMARMVFPIAKRALGMVGNVAANTAKDLIDDSKGFKQSFKDNALTEATRLIGNVANSAMTQKKTAPSSINKPNTRKRKHIRHTIFDKHR